MAVYGVADGLVDPDAFAEPDALAEPDAFAEPEALAEPDAPEPEGAGLAELAAVMGALIKSPLSTQ